MPKYNVTVSYTMERPIAVYASDEAEAEEKACDIVAKWNGVVETEATDIEEI